MKTLGVTGGIGSGKTAVCRILESLGARVFYADAVAKRIMQEDADARAEIAAAFGAESYDAAGRLDRAYLAERVFGDEEAVARINTIVHPRVFAAFEQAKAAATREGLPLLVQEAALIYESGADRHLDAVAVVDAPLDERVRRVSERDRVTPEQVLARVSHQLPPEELRRRADFVIENTGTLEALREQVRAVFAAMTGTPGPP